VCALDLYLNLCSANGCNNSSGTLSANVYFAFSMSRNYLDNRIYIISYNTNPENWVEPKGPEPFVTCAIGAYRLQSHPATPTIHFINCFVVRGPEEEAVMAETEKSFLNTSASR
jgi:hypothetical protein